MKLAEAISTINRSQKRMKYVIRELHESDYIPPGMEPDQWRLNVVRQIRGMVGTRAALRRRIAQTLQDHPELVEALAERKVARLRYKVLKQLPSPTQPSKPVDVFTNPLVWTFDLLFEDIREPAYLPVDSGEQKSEPVFKEYYSYKTQKEEAWQRLKAAELKVERLSAQIDLRPDRRDRSYHLRKEPS